MNTPTHLVLKPSDLPLRITLLVPEGSTQRAVTYVLRVTRAGGLLLNKDELAPAQKAA
jgi:hypothetical protein